MLNLQQHIKNKEEEATEELQKCKLIIQDELNKGLLKYVRDGLFIENFNNYIKNFSEMLSKYKNRKEIINQLFNYRNEIIEQASNECFEKIKNLNGLYFIDSFIDFTKRLNFLIYYLNEVFTALYFSSEQYENYPKSSMDIYKKCFFDKLQEKLFRILYFDLFKKERNLNNAYNLKIKYIIEILNYIESKNLKLKKVNETTFVWEEISEEDNNDNNNNDNKINYFKKWFDYFREEALTSIKNKIIKIFASNPALEDITNKINNINEDLKKLSNYISNPFYIDINNVIYEHLFKEEINKILNVKDLLDNEKTSILKEVIELYRINPECFNLIKKALNDYIVEKGKQICDNKELIKSPYNFISALIKLKKSLDELSSTFLSKNEVEDIENKAFHIFLNKDDGDYNETIAITLAKYIDYSMKFEFDLKKEKELDDILNGVIFLYNNINSKLTFQVNYEKMLSDRFLKSQLSVIIKSEKALISKLGEVCDTHFLKKIRGMIKDIEANKAENDAYKLTESKGSPNGIDFNVKILSNCFWDIRKIYLTTIEIPRSLKFCIDDYENYFLNKYQEKKLIWCFGYSKLKIQYLYLKEQSISLSTLPQVLALLLLEQNEKLNLKKLAELLKYDIQLLKYELCGLIFNPSFNEDYKVNKGIIIADIDQYSREFKDTTEISINKKIIISKKEFNTIPKTEKQLDTIIEMKNQTERYQNSIIQTTIVRILKERIGMETTIDKLIILVNHKIDLFHPSNQQILDNIEKLIDKECVKRDGIFYEYIP